MAELPLLRFPRVSLAPPRRRILARLGYNRHNTVLYPHHLALLDAAIDLGFAACEPRAVAARVRVTDRTRDEIRLAGGAVLRSRSLRRLLDKSREVLLAAATVGPGIMREIAAAIERGDATRAAILDAVGSESVDSILDWVGEYLGRGLPREGRSLTRRFSPGYGDLGLENQALVFSLLRLDDELGLELTERFMLVPEKSVIGISGIE